MEMIKISVIIPVYNVENYLARCLNSIVNQTYKNLEIICINDGSKDNSLKIIEEYAKNDSRIKIINQENKGIAATRNVGIENVTGEYFIFVDSDDYIELNTCEKLIKTIENNSDVDMIAFQKYYDRNGEIIQCNHFRKSPFYQEMKDKVFCFNEKQNEFLKSIHAFHLWDRIYKTNFVKTNNLNFKIGLQCAEDNIFLIQLLTFNPKIMIIDEYFYYYVTRTISLSQINRMDYVKLHIDIAKMAMNILNEAKASSVFSANIFNYYLNVLLDEWNVLYFTKEKNEYFKIIKNYINDFKTFGITFEDVKETENYKRYKKLKTMADLKLYFVYFKIFRKIVKYSVVIPYKKIRKVFSHS